MNLKRGVWITIALLIGFCSLSAALSPAQAQGVAHGGEKILRTAPQSNGPLPSLRNFIRQVHNGQADQIVGLYVPGVLAVQVELQPQDSPFYVTDDPDNVSLFSAPLTDGTVGLLAHSHLAGASFSQLEIHQPALLIFGDGHLLRNYVNRIEAYQALEPSNPYSAFVSLDGGSRWNSQDLFRHIYGSGQQLVLQTCLEQDGQSNWGRLFVIASPFQIKAATTSLAFHPRPPR